MRRIASSITVRFQDLQEKRYLSGLKGEILRHLAENTRLIAYDADETIIHEGQHCQDLNLVESGRGRCNNIFPPAGMSHAMPVK